MLFSGKNKKIRNILDDVPGEYGVMRPAEAGPEDLLRLYRVYSRLGDIRL